MQHNQIICADHRRSQAVQWVHLHPQSSKKLGVIYRENDCVSAPPGHEVHPLAIARVNFRTVQLPGSVNLLSI